MRPKLKIGPLINLQDARSSAAVGFDLITFSLRRGDNQKLAAAMVWNMVQWLSGPDVVLALDIVSLPELDEAKQSFEAGYISLPAQEAQRLPEGDYPTVILTASSQEDPQFLAEQLQALSQPAYLELTMSSLGELDPFLPRIDRCLLHFTSLDLAETYLKSELPLAWGLSLGAEAEEEPGLLDYERIDTFMEVFNERFELDD